MKEVIEETLGIEVDIERAHRVERKMKSTSASKRPRTIVCRLRDWKQKEAVIREARKRKPEGLYIAEDLAKATLKKREGQIAKMKEAKDAGKMAYFVLDRLIIRDRITKQSTDE